MLLHRHRHLVVLAVNEVYARHLVGVGPPAVCVGGEGVVVAGSAFVVQGYGQFIGGRCREDGDRAKNRFGRIGSLPELQFGELHDLILAGCDFKHEILVATRFVYHEVDVRSVRGRQGVVVDDGGNNGPLVLGIQFPFQRPVFGVALAIGLCVAARGERVAVHLHWAGGIERHVPCAGIEQHVPCVTPSAPLCRLIAVQQACFVFGRGESGCSGSHSIARVPGHRSIGKLTFQQLVAGGGNVEVLGIQVVAVSVLQCELHDGLAVLEVGSAIRRDVAAAVRGSGERFYVDRCLGIVAVRGNVCQRAVLYRIYGFEKRQLQLIAGFDVTGD